MPSASRCQPSVLLMSVVLGVVGAIGSVTEAQAASFTPLPFGIYPDSMNSFGYQFSYLQLSGDGTAVVGGLSRDLIRSGPDDFNSVEAFRWTQSKGLQLLGGNPNLALGTSYDGSTVVGRNGQAFLWTEPGGIQSLGYLPGLSASSVASAVSADGITIVGNTSNSSIPFSSFYSGQAFRWTPANGMQGLGYLKIPMDLIIYTDYMAASRANDISGNGAVIVGTSNFYSLVGTSGFSNIYDEAFRWTSAGGMQGLGFLPGGNYSYGNAVSQDGQTIVGLGSTASSYPDSKAFRWTEITGMQELDNLGYFLGSSSRDVSGDGSTIVGGGYGINGEEAFVWTEAGGLKPLQGVLTAAGIDLTGWSLSQATSISTDGLAIVGYGRNPSGQIEAWLARLDATSTPTAVPETPPITPLLAGLAAVGISLGRKHKQFI